MLANLIIFINPIILSLKTIIPFKIVVKEYYQFIIKI